MYTIATQGVGTQGFLLMLFIYAIFISLIVFLVSRFRKAKKVQKNIRDAELNRLIALQHELNVREADLIIREEKLDKYAAELNKYKQ